MSCAKPGISTAAYYAAVVVSLGLRETLWRLESLTVVFETERTPFREVPVSTLYYVCCQAPLSQRNNLDISGEKPYECGTCGKKFIQKGNWRRHELRVHSSSSANKTYQCPQCPESFAELHLMTAHHITAHLSPQGLLANGAFKKDMRKSSLLGEKNERKHFILRISWS